VTTGGESIVSLIASATEIVCALGLRDRLVGISHECDFPEDVRGLPVCSEPRLDATQPSGQIDRAVRDLVREGASVYHVRTEVLERLRPDLIVTQDQCHVCAVSLADVEQACSTLAHKPVRICSLTPHKLDDIYADFERVGAAAGVPDRGQALVSALQGRLNTLQSAVAGAPRPKVVCVEWLDPPMVAGGWMPELVQIAGGTPVLVTSPERFRTVDWQDIDAADADVAVIMPCGYPIGRTLEELGDSRIGSAVRRLRATRSGRTFVADGNAYFNRPGPRIAESAEILAALLHLERFAGYGTGAQRWP
jgi:iron complex transport system substrate-binding protein